MLDKNMITSNKKIIKSILYICGDNIRPPTITFLAQNP